MYPPPSHTIHQIATIREESVYYAPGNITPQHIWAWTITAKNDLLFWQLHLSTRIATMTWF